MKKIFVTCCLLMFAYMVSAQQGGQMSPERLAEMRAQQYERMKSELSLTDTQLAAIKKVDDEFYYPKMQELRQQAGGNFNSESMRTEMTKLNEERNEKIKPLISAAQYAKFVESFTGFGRGRPGGQGGGGNR